MISIIERVLTERYGTPTMVPGAELAEYRWNEHREPLRCVLYKAPAAGSTAEAELPVLRSAYGDVLGGFLLLDSLKLAMRAGPPVYGLYAIDDLGAQPEVMAAKRLDPDIQFFMDAANVWFYGMKNDELYVYDSETAELERMGPFAMALRELLQQWEQATQP